MASSLDTIGERAWNDLASGSQTNTVFQTHQWAQSWLSAFASEYEPLIVSAYDKSGLVGIAPLVRDRRSKCENVVRFVGDGRADYCDFLVTRRKPEAFRALLTAVFENAAWTVLELNNIPAHSGTAEAVLRMSEEAGLNALVKDQFLCPALLIEGHELEAQAIFNKPSLRRRRNYFERKGHLVARALVTSADILPQLETFFEQHITRWGHANPSLFLNAANRTFYRELTQRLGKERWVLFSTIELDGRPIAFHFGFDYNGSVLWYKPSFDIAFARRSPGSVLVRHLIGWAIDNGRRELDFTVGDEPFKRRFTNTVRKTVNIKVFRNPIGSHFERSRRTLTSAIKRFPGVNL